MSKKVTVSAGKYGKLLLAPASNAIVEKRYKRLMTKEPTTIKRMGGFLEGSVFIDVGANIGLYSVFAAKFRRCRVFSFEPQALNYAALCKNVSLNGLGDTVTAYCLAISDRILVSDLFIRDFSEGQSHNDFGVEQQGCVKQGCAGFPLDYLVDQGAVTQPHYIKIDVDGFEHKAVAGMEKTLASPEMKSILIEIDRRIPEHLELVKRMVDTGWVYNPKQVERSLPSSAVEFNYIFHRGS